MPIMVAPSESQASTPAVRPRKHPGISAADLISATLQVNNLPPLTARAITAEIILDLHHEGYFVGDEATMRDHFAIADATRVSG